MDRRWDTGPHLDTEVEPWRATFSGLGTVLVDKAGELSIYPDQPGDDIENALRWGWGENLSLARKGHLLLTGSTVVAPDRERALLLTGDAHDVAIVLLALVSNNWQVLADRVAPTAWDGHRLLALPREAPVVVSRRRARKAGWEGRDIRQDSNAVAVEVPRWQEPVPLWGIVQLRSAKASEPVVGEPLTGARLIEAAAALRAPGALAVTVETAEDDPETAHQARARAAMQEDLRLARAAAILRLGFDSDRQDEVLDTLLQWFDQEAV